MREGGREGKEGWGTVLHCSKAWRKGRGGRKAKGKARQVGHGEGERRLGGSVETRTSSCFSATAYSFPLIEQSRQCLSGLHLFQVEEEVSSRHRLHAGVQGQSLPGWEAGRSGGHMAYCLPGSWPCPSLPQLSSTVTKCPSPCPGPLIYAVHVLVDYFQRDTFQMFSLRGEMGKGSKPAVQRKAAGVCPRDREISRRLIEEVCACACHCCQGTAQAGGKGGREGTGTRHGNTVTPSSSLHGKVSLSWGGSQWVGRMATSHTNVCRQSAFSSPKSLPTANNSIGRSWHFPWSPSSSPPQGDVCVGPRQGTCQAAWEYQPALLISQSSSSRQEERRESV